MLPLDTLWNLRIDTCVVIQELFVWLTSYFCYFADILMHEKFTKPPRGFACLVKGACGKWKINDHECGDAFTIIYPMRPMIDTCLRFNIKLLFLHCTRKCRVCHFLLYKNITPVRGAPWMNPQWNTFYATTETCCLLHTIDIIGIQLKISESDQ